MGVGKRDYRHDVWASFRDGSSSFNHSSQCPCIATFTLGLLPLEGERNLCLGKISKLRRTSRQPAQMIYTNNCFTSCLYSVTLPTPEDQLLIIDTENHELVSTILLESTVRLFVRNNKSYLYYGTHSEYGADGIPKWVLRFFDMTKRHLSRRKIHLSNLVGHEIGSTVCFEIIDGYLYGMSNQTAFEVEEIDWTSYYYCFRFPLDEPDPDKTQVMKKRDCWRRQHAEGPIDDRWGFLKLEQDETTGKLRMIESRKEWLTGQSGNRRSYYTTDVVFKDDVEGTADEESEDNTENNLPDDPLVMLLESISMLGTMGLYMI
ncbi:hypothetical protein PG995_005427 [Apiospora arundinis]